MMMLMSGGASLLASEFYVAPGGDDGNPGTQSKPFATIEAARDAVRSAIEDGMQADITVHLAAGDYFVEKTVMLDERDSGRDGHVVIYKGAPDLGTRIYGGRRITNWQALNDTEFVAEVPDLQQHFTLYENERAANGGIFHTFRDAPEGDWRKDGTKLIYHPRTLPIDEQVIVLGTAKDVFRIEGSSMENIAGNLVFDGLYMIGSDFAPTWKKGDSYWTTWDGEYDGRPWKGKTLTDAVIAPDMRHGQFYIENARNVVIRNSKLYGAGFMAAMYNRWAQECVVENNWIENAGCNGLFFMGWEAGRGPFSSPEESYVNKKHVIRNNVFYDIGRFSNFAAGMYFNFSGDNLVEHNIFHGITHYAVALKGWRPKLINPFFLVNREDEFKDAGPVKPFGMDQVKLYGSYVVTEENQGAEVLHSRNTLVRYNDMSQIARSGDDMGMINMWGAGTGNVWEYNACHDGVNTASLQHWLHVLFNDDGCHKAVVRGNLIYWITGGVRSRGIMLKGNYQETVNNIIADCILDGAATIGPYVESAHNMIWSRNIVEGEFTRLYSIGSRKEKVGQTEQPVLREADNNVYHFRKFGPDADPGKAGEGMRRQLAGEQKGGKLEQNSVYADPKFVRRNPWWATDYTDYKLQPDSPALARGFQEADLEKIGLVAGYPFDLKQVFDHPAGRIWKAAAFNRLYNCRISNQVVCPFDGQVIAKDAWACYKGVDFGDGQHTSFVSRVNWLPPQQTFEKEINGKPFLAVVRGDVWGPHPYWEVSPAFKIEGKTGPELFDEVFAPETQSETVTWQSITEPLKSRLTVEYPLGVMNLDIATGEENSNSAAYMRSSLYANRGGKTDIEIRGAHGVKLWLNGEQVFAQLGNVGKSERVAVTFKQGWNTLLMKVVQDDKPWAPYTDRGNFWATVNIHYAALGNAHILPGLPGKELLIDPERDAGIEVRLGSPEGRLIGNLKWREGSCEIEKTTGVHDLYLVFPARNVQTVDWYRFE
jgi:hypothetical protein